MTADVELLPCPFCRKQVFLHHGHNGIGFVTCGQREDGSDGCGVIASFRPNKGGKAVIAAWNRRAAAAQAAEIEALRAEVETATRMHAITREHLEATEARAEQLTAALEALLDKLKGTGIAPLERIEARRLLKELRNDEGTDPAP